MTPLTTSEPNNTPQLTVLGVYCRPNDDDDDDSSTDEEEAEAVKEEEEEEKEDPKVIKARKTMIRRRMKLRRVLQDQQQKDDDEKEEYYETAMFVPKDGLTKSMFYHNDVDDHTDDEDSDEEEEEDYPVYEINEIDRVYEERAILLQSYEHYQQLADDPHTSSYFDSMKKKKKDDGNNNLLLEEDLMLENPRFGEQIIIKGLDSKQICIGDIFAVPLPNNNDAGDGYEDYESHNDNQAAATINNLSYGLMIEVTSPRLACAECDKKNCSPFGRSGIRRYTNTHGMAGWFVRVLQGGQVMEGTTLQRISHPHPQWNLREVATALYGESWDPKYHNLGWAQWNRSKTELQELCSIQQLGWYEWKDEAQWILDRWEKIQTDKEKLLMAKEAKEKEEAMEPPAITTATTAMPSLKNQIRHDLFKFDEQVKNFVLTKVWNHLTKKPTNIFLISIGLILSFSYQWQQQTIFVQGADIMEDSNNIINATMQL